MEKNYLQKGGRKLKMSDEIKKINSFFKDANKPELNKIESQILLSERQEKIFSDFDDSWHCADYRGGDGGGVFPAFCRKGRV